MKNTRDAGAAQPGRCQRPSTTEVHSAGSVTPSLTRNSTLDDRSRPRWRRASHIDGRGTAPAAAQRGRSRGARGDRPDRQARAARARASRHVPRRRRSPGTRRRSAAAIRRRAARLRGCGVRPASSRADPRRPRLARARRGLQACRLRRLDADHLAHGASETRTNWRWHTTGRRRRLARTPRRIPLPAPLTRPDSRLPIRYDLIHHPRVPEHDQERDALVAGPRRVGHDGPAIRRGLLLQHPHRIVVRTLDADDRRRLRRRSQSTRAGAASCAM